MKSEMITFTPPPEKKIVIELTIEEARVILKELHGRVMPGAVAMFWNELHQYV